MMMMIGKWKSMQLNKRTELNFVAEMRISRLCSSLISKLLKIDLS